MNKNEDSWTQLIAFTYAFEAHVVKGRLESDGIDVIIKDELTIQVNPFYSNTIGGVKLLVKESDYQKAYALLVETGYLKDDHGTSSSFINGFDRLSSRIPLLRKFRLELRLLLSVIVGLILIIVPVALILMPSTTDKLVENSWKIEKIYYKGQELPLRSLGLVSNDTLFNSVPLVGFMKNGDVIFPGSDSFFIWCKWQLKNDSIIITKGINKDDPEIKEREKQNGVRERLARLESMYLGKYSLEMNLNSFVMKSENVTIIGRLIGNNSNQ